jgi:hypothetical protein
MTEYTYDVTLSACIRTKAASEAEALATLRDCCDTMDCNGGAWPNGQPIVFEASVTGEPSLAFIDDEPAPYLPELSEALVDALDTLASIDDRHPGALTDDDRATCATIRQVLEQVKP